MPPLLILPVRTPAPTPLFPVITTPSLPSATVGAAYSFQLSASSGVAPYTWSIVSASPNTGSWLSLSSSGLLTGTPGTAELELLTIQVTDANGRVGTSPFRLFAVAGGGGGVLTHGLDFAITGTGFGSKALNLTPIWDNCSHGQAVSARWTKSFPTVSTGNFNLGYRTPASLGRGIVLPHSNIAAYLCGAHNDGGAGLGANTGTIVGFGKVVARPAMPCWSIWSYYGLIDPSWVSGKGSPNDNNFKMYDYGIDSGPYNGNTSWYFGATSDRGFVSGAVTTGLGVNDDASGGFMNMYGSAPPAPYTPGNYSMFPNAQFQGWAKHEIKIRWGTPANTGAGATGPGRIWWNVDNAYNGGPQSPHNQTNSFDFNAVSGTVGGYTDKWTGPPGDATNRLELLGGYARSAPDANNWRYFADIWYDIGPNPGYFCLTNNATYASSTLVETQPYTPGSWSDLGATLNCNKGRLSAGTVHLHYRNDETLAHQYLGPRTMS